MALRLLSFHIPVLWLKPSLEVVSRDGSSEYAAAIRKGAPQARQVSDRWHLVKNLTACVSAQLAKTLAQLRRAEERRPARTQAVQQVQQARQAERTARYEHILELHTHGVKSGEIGRRAWDEPTHDSTLDRDGNHPLRSPETTTSQSH